MAWNTVPNYKNTDGIERNIRLALPGQTPSRDENSLWMNIPPHWKSRLVLLQCASLHLLLLLTTADNITQGLPGLQWAVFIQQYCICSIRKPLKKNKQTFSLNQIITNKYSFTLNNITGN